MENKITKEELKKITKYQEDLQKVILDIGVAETKKHAMLHKVAEINNDIEEYTKVENEEDKKD